MKRVIAHVHNVPHRLAYISARYNDHRGVKLVNASALYIPGVLLEITGQKPLHSPRLTTRLVTHKIVSCLGRRIHCPFSQSYDRVAVARNPRRRKFVAVVSLCALVNEERCART